MSSKILLPCPFCGGEAKLNVLYDDFHQVGCSNPLCKVLPQTWSYDTDEEAIEAWNRRENKTWQLPPAQPEPLTDKEQRIFLAAMGREEKVCEEVDRNHVREPYEDSLMRVCKEIRRKVKGALWT